MAKKSPTTMSAAHKAALATGRAESRAVKDYLQALEDNRPKRGRRRTSGSIQQRLETIEASIPTSEPINRLSLIQERNDLTAELATMSAAPDIARLEEAFTKVAKSYSERKGIGYSAWREVGVPVSVLKSAGVSRAG